jgi:glycosyltransferase involved in cell wall biosynthesis
MSTRVSVVIPAYNCARYIEAAVQSALAQTHQNLEVVAIDDGSKDETLRVLESVADARLRVISQPNAGVSVARNNGVAQSSGDYLAFLDADDEWLPQKLEKQLTAMQSENAQWSYTSLQLINDAGDELEIQHSPRVGDLLEDLMLRGNVVSTPSSVVVERKLWNQSGGFDPDLSHSADWDLWIRLARLSPATYVREPLVRYRWHETNMSRNARLLESDTLRCLNKAFEQENSALKNARYKALARQWMVIAGCYFQAGEKKDFARCAREAVCLDPRQGARLLSYPLRRVMRVLGKHSN